jgi:uncharacterized protein
LKIGKQGCFSDLLPAGAAAPVFYFLVSILCFLSGAGCAAPGDPRPPHPPVPAAITDLAARQTGDSVVLTFTLPRTTVENEPLSGPPTVEIFRSFAPATAMPAAAGAPKTLVYTIPSALVNTYTVEGRVRFPDPIAADELARHAGEQAIYIIRTRASKRADSADSNPAALRLFLAPEPIRDVSARVTRSAVELSWTPPERNAAGGPLPALTAYHVYRAEVASGAEAEAEKDPANAKLLSPLDLLGVTPSAGYRDTQFQFGHTYIYSVRSVGQFESESVESADSKLVVVSPRDVFSPSPPQDLVAVVVPATAQAHAHIELSWSISPEPDIAGYNIYRSEAGGAARQRLNPDLLLTPVFHDMSTVSGRSYTYTVTAVSRAGNESEPSVAVPAVMPE